MLITLHWRSLVCINRTFTDCLIPLHAMILLSKLNKPFLGYPHPWIIEIFFCILKFINFRGDLTDILSKTSLKTLCAGALLVEVYGWCTGRSKWGVHHLSDNSICACGITGSLWSLQVWHVSVEWATECCLRQSCTGHDSSSLKSGTDSYTTSQNIQLFLGDTLILYITCFMVKILAFWGDLSNVLPETKSLRINSKRVNAYQNLNQVRYFDPS